MKKTVIKYRESEVEAVFQKLVSNWVELANFYQKEVTYDYEAPSDRLPYVEMGDIARFIVDKKKSDNTEHFIPFFENVEELMIHGDQYTRELMVVGLFEGIQNRGGSQIDYYRSFDKWLKPESLKAWRKLIEFWEKDDWKKTSESEKILRKGRR
ncbi:hypothetical protein KFE98_12385 [bacterium SCSIO 12741]|nr:hypothetical protein KFE98_12385 [bacterium SCSIO 12741]